MSRGRLVVASLFLLCVAVEATAQTPARRLTTLEALRQFPGYYHLQNVLLRGSFAENGTRIMLSADDRQMEVMLGDTRTTPGLVEVRAQLLDIGRLEPGDPRLLRYAGLPTPERWPRPGEEMLLSVTAVTSVDTATTPSVRALSLEPWKFDGQPVTITGQFRGRNLFGDLPGSPALSKYDFVLKGGDGAIWVTGMRPKGKGFDLDVDARVDTSKWVQVTGVVRRERAMVVIEATSLAAALPILTTVVEEPAPPPAPLVAAEVVFSAPSVDETDVPVSSPVRLQFSRGLTAATVAGNIRVTYAAADAATPLTPLEFQTSYDAPNRAIEIRFTTAVERFRRVTVETLPGLKTFDGAPVTPWTLTFTFGG